MSSNSEPINDRETGRRPQRWSPYQGLIPYDEDDAAFFFGRKKETRLVTANLFASPLTLLYGASGVGKTSVLRAGVAHGLRQRDDVVLVIFASWQGDPAAELKQSVREATGVELADSTPLATYLSKCAKSLRRRILIVLDQFEEYFLYHPVDDVLAMELPAAVMIADAPVSCLLSIRDDFFSRLDRFEGRIPALFDTYYRIEHLDRAAAKQAIEKPIEEFNRRLPAGEPCFDVQPELVEAVLNEVRSDAWFLGQTGRGVLREEETAPDRFETPYLQLVMTRLWEQEIQDRSRMLRLETFQTLGLAKVIVREHLDAAMAALPAGEQDIAASVFHFLVTPGGNKIAHSPRDLAEYSKSPPEDLKAMLEKLASGKIRILRGTASPGEPEPRYEIFHDALAPAILDWRLRHVQKQEKAAAEAQLRKERLEAEQKRREQERELQQAQALAEAERKRSEAESQRAEEQERRVEAEKQRTKDHIRTARRLRYLLAALGIMFLVVVTLGFYLARERVERLKAQRQAAKDRAALAEKRQTGLVGLAATGNFSKLREYLNLTADQRLVGIGQGIRIVESPSSLSRVPLEYGLKLWRNGATLRVRFLDGDPVVQERVEKFAQEWTKYANLHFEFGSALDAVVRVSFSNPGSWSYVGTDALQVAPDQPTINFGWLTKDVGDIEMKRAVLHEFGHVCGLIEELANPNAAIPWDKPAVYRYFEGPPYYWEPSEVEQQIFRKESGVEYRDFDPKSIMMQFAIPKELTIGDFESGFTKDLSASDKEFARKLYPPQQ